MVQTCLTSLRAADRRLQKHLLAMRLAATVLEAFVQVALRLCISNVCSFRLQAAAGDAADSGGVGAFLRLHSSFILFFFLSCI